MSVLRAAEEQHSRDNPAAMATQTITIAISEPTPESGDKPSSSAVYRNAISKNGFPGFDQKTMWEMHAFATQKFTSQNAIGWRPKADGKAGAFKWMTYAKFAERVASVSAALLERVGPKGKASFISPNTPEIPIIQYASARSNITIVPLYDTLGEQAVVFILNHSESSLIFSHTSKLAAIAKALPEAEKHVKTVVYFGSENAAGVKAVEDTGVTVISFEAFEKEGAANPRPAVPPTPEDIACLMFTSGTTGNPKGVMVKHKQMVAASASMHAFLKQGNLRIDHTDYALSYLTLAHILAQVAEAYFFYVGAKVGYWQGDIKKVSEDIAALRPTMLVAVPRVLDRIMAGIEAKIKARGGLAATLFRMGLGSKLKALDRGAAPERASWLWDTILFKKAKAQFGGRIRFVVSGGAPLAPHVEQFMKAVLCVPVVQGYGLTETTGTSFVQLPTVKTTVTGAVGPPTPATEFKFESVKDMSYDAMGTPPKGEICIRGPMVFEGYYKDPEKTAECFDQDGFFHTGDVGELTVDGTLRITDRIKNMFKLSQGEYIASEYLESIYAQASIVEQVWVYGSSLESSIVAVVVPNKEAIEAWAKSNGVSGDYAAICADEKAKKYVQEEIVKVSKTRKLKGFEIARAVFLEPNEFSVDNDLMTTTFKLKRNQLQKRYQKEIDAMYKQINAKS